jgi:hypothetical protein
MNKITAVIILAVITLATVNLPVSAQDPTPQMEGTPEPNLTDTPTPTFEPMVKTSTPRPTEDNTCPGYQPIGWGQITPDPRWLDNCRNCITPTVSDIWPTYGVPGCSTTPTPYYGKFIKWQEMGVGRDYTQDLQGTYVWEMRQDYPSYNTSWTVLGILIQSYVSSPNGHYGLLKIDDNDPENAFPLVADLPYNNSIKCWDLVGTSACGEMGYVSSGKIAQFYDGKYYKRLVWSVFDPAAGTSMRIVKYGTIYEGLHSEQYSYCNTPTPHFTSTPTATNTPTITPVLPTSTPVTGWFLVWQDNYYTYTYPTNQSGTFTLRWRVDVPEIAGAVRKGIVYRANTWSPGGTYGTYKFDDNNNPAFPSTGSLSRSAVFKCQELTGSGACAQMGYTSEANISQFYTGRNTKDTVYLISNPTAGSGTSLNDWGVIYYGTYYAPTNTPTPTQQFTPTYTPTPVGGYCSVVQPRADDNNQFQVSGPMLGPTQCLQLGGWVIDLTWANNLIPELNLPDQFDFPGVNLCYRLLYLGYLIIFGIQIDFEAIMITMVGIAALRILWRS